MRLGDILKSIITSVAIMLLWNSCSPSHAQVLPVDLVIVKHKFATPLQAQKIVQLGLARNTETAVTHPIRKVTIVNDSLKRNKLSQYVSRLDSWTALALKRGWCENGTRCHLSLPPVVDKAGVDYAGGVAMGECTYGWKGEDASYSIARMMNGKKQSRLQSSITIVAHEVGHGDGAEHLDDNQNLMHSDALSFGEKKLPWRLFSKELVDCCMREVGLRAKSLYGYGDPTWSPRRLLSHRGKVAEPLIN